MKAEQHAAAVKDMATLVAESLASLGVGDRICARPSGLHEWFHGCVTGTSKDGRFLSILFDDGDKEPRVPRSLNRVLPPLAGKDPEFEPVLVFRHDRATMPDEAAEEEASGDRMCWFLQEPRDWYWLPSPSLLAASPVGAKLAGLTDATIEAARRETEANAATNALRAN
jgi:hypothetical protein